MSRETNYKSKSKLRTTKKSKKLGKLQSQSDQMIDVLGRNYELILNSVGEGIYGVDNKGLTTFVNEPAARMVGWKPEELIGK